MSDGSGASTVDSGRLGAAGRVAGAPFASIPRLTASARRRVEAGRSRLSRIRTPVGCSRYTSANVLQGRPGVPLDHGFGS